MKAYRNGVIIGLCLIFCLGAVSVTRSWFVSTDEIPLGQISAGVIHYLPESAMSYHDLLKYGNLIGGNSVDSDGIAHVLPGDKLLANNIIKVSGDKKTTTQTVSTSIVHNWNPEKDTAGETEGTIIHREERTAASGAVVMRRQRDLMTKSTSDIWTDGGGNTVSPPGDSVLAPLQKKVETPVTLVTEGTNGKVEKTVTTSVTMVTTYHEAGVLKFTHKLVNSQTVTYETATYTGGTVADWTAAAGSLPNLKSTEQVLFTGGSGNLTSSQLDLVYKRAYRTGDLDSGTNLTAPLPLTLENRSTLPSNVRMVATATITPKNGTPTNLAFEQLAGSWYAGEWVDGIALKDGTTGRGFVELLRLTPAAGWVAATDGTPPIAAGKPTQPAWDLTLGSGATLTKIISPVAPPPMPTPTPTAPVSPAPTPALPKPVYYPAMAYAGVAISPAFGVSETDFEKKFNELYCDDAKINLKISYLVKQADFMDWQEFHSERLTLQF